MFSLFSVTFTEEPVGREVGGLAHGHRSGAEALSTFRVRKPAGSGSSCAGGPLMAADPFSLVG